MSDTENAIERDETPLAPESDAGSGKVTNGDAEGIVRDARPLHVTVESVDDFFDRAGAKLERLEQGGIDALPHEKRLSFTTVGQSFGVFTPKWIELVDTVLRTRPESISALAETVGRPSGTSTTTPDRRGPRPGERADTGNLRRGPRVDQRWRRTRRRVALGTRLRAPRSWRPLLSN